MQTYCGFQPRVCAAVSASGESPAGTQHDASLIAVLVTTAWQERRSRSREELRERCVMFAAAIVFTLWGLTWWWTALKLDSLLGKRHTSLVHILAFVVFYAPASAILASLYCAWCVPSAHAPPYLRCKCNDFLRAAHQSDEAHAALQSALVCKLTRYAVTAPIT